MSMQRVGDMEIAQDLDFQRRSWVVQRIGWMFFGLIMLAAMLGFLGGGPLSAGTAGSDTGPLQVQYGRFVRHRAPTQMEIKLRGSAVQGDEARVWVDREYLNGVELQNVVPEPDSVAAGSDRIVYVFKLRQAGEPASVVFDIMPDQDGLRTARVGLEGGEELSFTQFVFP